MEYRLGVTTHPDERKREWLKIYPHLSDWVIMEQFDTRREAVEREMLYAYMLDCIPSDFEDASDDEAKGGGPWFVYRFAYKRSDPLDFS